MNNLFPLRVSVCVCVWNVSSLSVHILKDVCNIPSQMDIRRHVSAPVPPFLSRKDARLNLCCTLTEPVNIIPVRNICFLGCLGLSRHPQP